MEEKNGDAKTFWMELQDDGKVDLMFEKTQNVLHSLKQKIKDGSATNGDYVQAMNLVNEATLSNTQTLEKDHTPVTQSEQENKSSAVPSASCDNSCPKGCTIPSPGKKVFLPVKNKADNLVKKEAPLHISFHRHICSRTCLMETPLSLKGENPLQLPIRCHFQRRHAKTNSHSSALHVNYKTPCGRNLRNMEEVFHYLLETECNFLFTDNFSFNTYVQLTRNHPKQNEVVSDVDISNGVESVSIPFCNEIDNSKLPRFKYRNTVWPRIYHLNFSNMFSDSCDCSEGCIDIKKCACLQLTAKNAKACPLSSDGECAGYKYKRLQRLIPTGIYECNLLCKCNKQMCQNRVIQHGVRVRLQVFKSEKKGWGVRCLDDIDKGTFVCIYSGRLLRRATPEKTNIGENGREQQHIVKNSFSKKRKLEVVCSDCDAHCDSPKAEDCPPKLSGDLKEPAVEMNHRNISRTQHHSVIRRTKSKTTVFHYSEKNMGFVCSDSAAPEDKNGFKPAQEHVNSEARRAHEDLSSNPAGDSEDTQLTESDVIDITASREDSAPAYRCKHATIVDRKDTKQVLEVPGKKSQEEEPAASQSQQALCDEELPSERTKIPSASLMQLSKESLFLLDASKEGNVGRFLNHSCCPNLWVQNVFVETHDRNFPLVAFFTNRYVKARTELTWDYGYEAGATPAKEILCQCFCQLTEKMEKRTCALCPEGHDWSVIYFVPSANIAAHENCLLYSSGLVECEAHNPCKIARNVDVKSVLERIWRGSTMICSFCNNEGAIVRCGETSCAKNYHLFCAKEDYAVLQGGVTRTYKLFCPEHPPQQEEATESADGPSMKRKRGRKKRLSSGPPAQPKVVKFMRSKRHVTGEPLGHRDAAVKAPFLKKCKKAGLLNVLLEYILEKMNSIYGRLLDETASESDYEGIETLLFGCGLFKDTLRKFQEVIKSKACEWEERQRQMKQQLEALADLQQSLCSFQENGDLDCSSSTSGSLLPPEDHQ